MIRTIYSILITLAVILSLSLFEVHYVKTTFDQFRAQLCAVYEKSESQTATYQDGTGLLSFWEHKKDWLHLWLPHTALQEVDYQLNEALGYLYLADYENVIPKLSVLINMSENIPDSYSIRIQNIL